MQSLHQYQADRCLFLPTTRQDLQQRGWEDRPCPLDFVFVTGDAYVDHPSFGPALLGRLLESHGYRVGIIAQPDWQSAEDFARLGRPRLGFLVSGGNMDSMVANYTVSGKPRRQDAYSPGGVGGRRPDRATLVYCARIREAFKKVDIIIGGIEASLRRLAHYDCWSDRLRRSILLDSKADLLIYGMGERALLATAAGLAGGQRAADLTTIPGTVWKCRTEEVVRMDSAAEALGRKRVLLPDWDALRDPAAGKRLYSQSFLQQHRNTDSINGHMLVEPYGPWSMVQNPPAPPLESEELDRLYELPYTRTFHPDYLPAGGVPAVEEVRFSLIGTRGCFGGCTFCALTFHQGRRVQARTQESLVREGRALTALPGFKGFIHDVGGPTANFRLPSCQRQLTHGVCKDKQCLFPKPCEQLQVTHGEYREILRALRALPGVKKVFIRSGIRFDYLLLDRDGSFLSELCENHVSGQLKVAPEHIAPGTLKAMGKPAAQVYRRFRQAFDAANRKLGKPQFLVPYFISSHPGTTLDDAIALAEFLRDQGASPEQVQDYYPTPGTVASCMYYTELNPRTGEPVIVPKSPRDKAMQRALLQVRHPDHHQMVCQALVEAGRTDLIGTSPRCLVGPRRRPCAAPKPIRRPTGTSRRPKK